MKNESAVLEPEISLSIAENVMRTIARRKGEAIRKRRSPSMKRMFGDGYMIVDVASNFILSGGRTHDGCDLSLKCLASHYAGNKENTDWQETVLRAVLAGQVAEN